MDADGPKDATDKIEKRKKLSLFPAKSAQESDDEENDVDFLMDDVDQFLSEIVNQRWSVN